MPTGNLRDWWTPADGKAFEERALCVDKQYSSYTAVDDVKLNGKLTLGENVADNGGVRLAWMALHGADEDQAARRERRRPHAASSASSSAGGRCGARTAADEIARLHAKTNPHSPGRYRTNRRRVEHAGVREGVQLSRRPRRWSASPSAASGEGSRQRGLQTAAGRRVFVAADLSVRCEPPTLRRAASCSFASNCA